MQGLPEEVFQFISRVTPLINVDLLIKNSRGQTLLTWREDDLLPPGWHIPGGIIRFKEKFSERIHAVAKNELGAEIRFEPNPLAMNEFIHPFRALRGHFISFLFNCSLTTAPDDSLKMKAARPQVGEWAWHNRCPDNLLLVQKTIYEKFF